MPDREAWITGIGLVSSLGEGLNAHQSALSAGAGPKLDSARFAPYAVHPMAPLDLDKQIPKKGDQRQMEPWQRYGTYAAGLALESAGIKGNTDILSRTHMIVAAGGGERDNAVDIRILDGLRTAENKGRFLNERLMGDLRPTLFLAQLSNLLAGNISIVHGVVGSSRTFMGEEASGVDAVRIALSRLLGGTGDIFLVGGAFNAEREDMLLLFELGGALLHGDFAPAWSRKPQGGGLVLGSMASFLVLEERSHAEARGAKPYAKLTAVHSGRTRRNIGDVKAAVAEHLAVIAGDDDQRPLALTGARRDFGLARCGNQSFRLRDVARGDEQAGYAVHSLAHRRAAVRPADPGSAMRA
ncbi:MAG: beta-ketoacyl-ACP synthase [Blastochloris sp.]|nr:beta-ketoacyl-ACP synthase [Blastochloris sp.]